MYKVPILSTNEGRFPLLGIYENYQAHTKPSRMHITKDYFEVCSPTHLLDNYNTLSYKVATQLNSYAYTRGRDWSRARRFNSYLFSKMGDVVYATVYRFAQGHILVRATRRLECYAWVNWFHRHMIIGHRCKSNAFHDREPDVIFRKLRNGHLSLREFGCDAHTTD